MCHHHSLVTKNRSPSNSFSQGRQTTKTQGAPHDAAKKVEPDPSADRKLKSPGSLYPLV